MPSKDKATHQIRYMKRSYYRSIAIVGLAVLLVAGFVATYSLIIHARIRQNTQEAAQEHIGYVASMVNAAFQKNIIAASQMAGDTNLSILARAKTPLTAHQWVLLNEFNHSMSQFVAANADWSCTALYLARSNYMQEGAAWRSPTMLYEAMDYGCSLNQWYAELNGLRCTEIKAFPSKDKSRIYFEIWCPLGGTRVENLGAVIIRLNEVSIREVLDGARGSENEVLMILDADRQPLLTTSNLYTSLPGDEHTSFMAGSELNEWTYVSFPSDEVLYGNLAHYQTILVAFLALLLIGGILVGLQLLRSNYAPMERIYSVVANKQTDAPEVTNLEEASRYIQQSYTELFENYDAARLDNIRKQKYVRNHLLNRLISPTWDGSVLYSPTIFNQNGIHLDQCRCGTLMIVCPGIERNTNMGDLETDHQQLQMNELFETVLQEQFRAMFLVWESNSLGILTWPDTDHPLDDLRNICLETGRDIHQKLGLKLCFVFSGPVDEVSGLREAANTCLLTEDYLETLQERPDFACYSDYKKLLEIQEGSSLTAKRADPLCEALERHHYDRAQQLIENELKVTGREDDTTLAMKSLRIIDILTAYLDADASQRLLACMNPDRIKAESMALLRDLNEADGENTAEGSDSAVEWIIQHIDENLSDYSLGVGTLSDEVHMSISALSRSFKQKTGVNLLDYINQQRINEVSRLLKETNKTLNEIVANVGYVNISTLNRNFKKYMGTTPGKYRQMVQRA